MNSSVNFTCTACINNCQLFCLPCRTENYFVYNLKPYMQTQIVFSKCSTNMTGFCSRICCSAFMLFGRFCSQTVYCLKTIHHVTYVVYTLHCNLCTYRCHPLSLKSFQFHLLMQYTSPGIHITLVMCIALVDDLSVPRLPTPPRGCSLVCDMTLSASGTCRCARQLQLIIERRSNRGISRILGKRVFKLINNSYNTC